MTTNITAAEQITTEAVDNQPVVLAEVADVLAQYANSEPLTSKQQASMRAFGHALNALGQPNAAQQLLAAANQPHRCDTHTWCTELGNHTMHASAYIGATTPDGYGDVVLPANIMAEDGQHGLSPFVGFLDLDLTPVQTRARVAELRHHLDNVAALADQVDGVAPLEPAAECYSVTARGSRGAVISAEIFTDDSPEPDSVIAVFCQPDADADLDVAGADQLIADLEEFLPRLRALRNQLAASVDGPGARP